MTLGILATTSATPADDRAAGCLQTPDVAATTSHAAGEHTSPKGAATRQSELSIESDLAWVDSLGITGASSLGDCAVVLNETPHEETPP